MSWSTPATATAGDVLTAAWLNTYLRDNLMALLGPVSFWIDGQAIRPDLTNGCSAPSDTTLTAGAPLLMGAGFSGTVDQYCQFKLPVPKRWNAGTLTYRVRWASPNAALGFVMWSLQASASSDGDLIDQAFGTAQTVTDNFLGVKQEHLTAFSSALTIGNSPAKQDMVYCRLGRLATNAADTKTDQVFLLGVELSLTMDTVNDA